MVKIDELKKFSETINGKLLFNYNLKKTNWFNIGGTAKVFFKPDSLNELISFIKKFKKNPKFFRSLNRYFILINDKTFNGTIIKLGKKFSNISLLSNNIIVAGSSATDKKLAEFACENNIGGLEFLSCIPGSVGGGLRMNSGCFEKEFKDILLSVQALDNNAKIITIPASEIKFGYRENNLDKNLIFLSASFKGEYKEKKKIEETMKILKS